MLKNYRAYGMPEAILHGANKQLESLIIITANTAPHPLIDVDGMRRAGGRDKSLIAPFIFISLYLALKAIETSL